MQKFFCIFKGYATTLFSKGDGMYLKHIGIIISVFVLSFFISVASQEAIGKEKAPTANTFTNSVGMKFVLIPAGTFTMGSPPAEPGRVHRDKIFVTLCWE